MSRDEKIALCRKLKAEGLTVTEIHERTGIARATVGDYLLGDAHCRAVKLARGHRCPNCGQATADAVEIMCRDCIHDEAHEKALRVEAMWLAGKTRPEICAAMGWTATTFNVMQDRYRSWGYNLPYRQLGKRQPGKYAHCRPQRMAA